jgi:hypothetical protein
MWRVCARILVASMRVICGHCPNLVDDALHRPLPALSRPRRTGFQDSAGRKTVKRQRGHRSAIVASTLRRGVKWFQPVPPSGRGGDITSWLCDMTTPLCDITKTFCNVAKLICHIACPQCHITGQVCDMENRSCNLAKYICDHCCPVKVFMTTILAR